MATIVTEVVAKNKYEFCVQHLKIINNLLPVTLKPTELKVLAAFLSIDVPMPFSTPGRKAVMKLLRLTQGSLGNHLKSLQESKFIKRGEYDLEITPIVKPSEGTQTYQIKLELKDDDKTI